MNVYALKLIFELKSRQINISLKNGKLALDAPKGSMAALDMSEIRKYKEEICKLLGSLEENDIEYLYEQYEERASIYEYDAGYCKHTAEDKAMNDIVSFCEEMVKNEEHVSENVTMYEEGGNATESSY